MCACRIYSQISHVQERDFLLATLKIAHFEWHVQNCSFHHRSTSKHRNHRKKIGWPPSSHSVNVMTFVVCKTQTLYSCNHHCHQEENTSIQLQWQPFKYYFSDSGDFELASNLPLNLLEKNKFHLSSHLPLPLLTNCICVTSEPKLSQLSHFLSNSYKVT